MSNASSKRSVMTLFSNKNDILLFNYNNLLSIRFINFLNKICHKKIIIFFITTSVLFLI